MRRVKRDAVRRLPRLVDLGVAVASVVKTLLDHKELVAVSGEPMVDDVVENVAR